MKNYEDLKAVTKELRKNYESKEIAKNNYNDNIISYQQYMKFYELNKQEDLKLTIKQNIIKNNLFLEVHNKLMKIYKDVFQKYINKNIGEARKEEIRKIFINQLKDVINFEDNDCQYYNRFYLSFHAGQGRNKERTFNISIDKLKYDFTYCLENEEVKAYYNYEFPKYVENVEEETERLANLYNEAIEKQEKYQKELEELSDYIYSNFPKNLYTEDISILRRRLSLNW